MYSKLFVFVVEKFYTDVPSLFSRIFASTGSQLTSIRQMQIHPFRFPCTFLEWMERRKMRDWKRSRMKVRWDYNFDFESCSSTSLSQLTRSNSTKAAGRSRLSVISRGANMQFCLGRFVRNEPSSKVRTESVWKSMSSIHLVCQNFLNKVRRSCFTLL